MKLIFSIGLCTSSLLTFLSIQSDSYACIIPLTLLLPWSPPGLAEVMTIWFWEFLNCNSWPESMDRWRMVHWGIICPKKIKLMTVFVFFVELSKCIVVRSPALPEWCLLQLSSLHCSSFDWLPHPIVPPHFSTSRKTCIASLILFLIFLLLSRPLVILG